jgi:hypothetical protein
MLPSSAEVAHSLKVPWRLIEVGDKALADFDLSLAGFGKSYGAILLTAPAMVALLAAQRLKAGLINESGLFDAPGLAMQVLVVNLLSFVVIPGLVLALMWGVARSARGTSFIIAWNWSEVSVSLMLAVPAALYAIGWAPPVFALMFTITFTILAARLRYAVARTTLGSSRAASLLIVTLTFGIEIIASYAFAVGRF